MQTLAAATASGKSAAGPKSLLSALTQPATSTSLAKNPSGAPKNNDFAAIFSETVSKSMTASLENTLADQTETSQNSDLAASLFASLTQDPDQAAAVQPLENPNADLAAALLASYQVADTQTTVTASATTTSSQQAPATDTAKIQPVATANAAITQPTEQKTAPAQTKTTENTLPAAAESAPQTQTTQTAPATTDQAAPQQTQPSAEQPNPAKTPSADQIPPTPQAAAPASVAQDAKNEVKTAKTVDPKSAKIQTQAQPEQVSAAETGSEQVKTTYSKSQPKHVTPVTTQTAQTAQAAISNEKQVKTVASSETSGENALNLTFDLSAAAKVSATTPITHTAAAAGINSASLESQVSASAASALNRVGQSITVTLTPPELGRMTIKFEQDGGELIGRVEFENAAVGEQFGSSIPKIIQNLQETGVAVREIELIYKGTDQNQGSMADNNQLNNSNNRNSDGQRQYSNSEESDVAKQPVSYNLQSEQQSYSSETAVNVWI